MSLIFSAPEAPGAGYVQMANATGRILLGMLGCDTEVLEGKLRLRTMEARLSSITPELIAKRAVPPRRISATEYDNGSPKERLTQLVEELRQLCFKAKHAEAPSISWG